MGAAGSMEGKKRATPSFKTGKKSDGRESHKNDIVESKENIEARATTPPEQHAFIAIIFFISRESISRRRKRTETKTGVAIAFAIPRSSNHWLSAEASTPIVFIHLSASFQEKESRTEKKIGRRKEKEASNTRERQTNADNIGLKKKSIASNWTSTIAEWNSRARLLHPDSTGELEKKKNNLEISQIKSSQRLHHFLSSFIISKATGKQKQTVGIEAKESRRKGLKQTRSATTLQPSSPFPEADLLLYFGLVVLSHGVSKHGNYAKVELRSMLLDLTSNIIMRMVAGKRYYGVDVKEIEEARIFREILEEFFAYISMINVGDLIPMLQWVDITGHLKKLDRLSKKMDVFLQGLVDEHRDGRDRNTIINRFLALQEGQPGYYTDDIIKGHVLELFLGGTHTSATSMEWALANVLNHPDVLKKAKAELDAQVGDRLIEESDFAKLNYLQSIISENLRLCPVTPLIPPHMPSSDCTIGGNHVPAGTILFVNAWSLHRDPTLWDEPTSFKPERFESAGRVDACKYIPFGMGRRACPGDGLAKRVMILTLGSLIQCFELERVGENKIDMAEKTAVNMSKVEPLELMCRARPILDMLLS
ncbi:hypothetical protein NC651_007627 [Populus alba x Populus x berolinensis]|nr:hypothetical protein NC651_007627 [Populus alba x Populus x berolinensis]